MEKVERVRALIEFIRIAQEGKVRPDKNSGGTGVVRDAKYASAHLLAACKKLAEELDFEDLVVENIGYND